MSATPLHKVLVADDEESLRFVLGKLLSQEGCDVDEAADGDTALALAERNAYDLHILDIKMPGLDGMDVLRKIRRQNPRALVIMMTAFGTQKLAIEAMQAGAYDYFTKPFELDELRIVLRRALEKQVLQRKLRSLQEQLGDRRSFDRLVGHSRAMQPVFELVRRVVGHDITVLITGESGVGKEMIASAIHNTSLGSNRPFVKINCAAIPETLLESELFGHARGAFTGAVMSRPGKFEAADGGSILLDEIGEMPPSIQAKLLRVIQEKQVVRIGETHSRSVNVRIIAATNRDLGQMVREKTFREDLYFRINVLPIHIPPLRDRVEDISYMVAHFLRKYPRGDGREITGVTPDALSLLESYRWPGNVRELENVIQRAVVLTTGDVVDVDSLPAGLVRAASRPAAPTPVPEENGAGDLEFESGTNLAERIERIVAREEKRIILAALRRMNQRRQETADLLGISRKSLHNKMQKYGLLKSRNPEDPASAPLDR
jgi:DNA-binding NtrC family response regulator